VTQCPYDSRLLRLFCCLEEGRGGGKGEGNKGGRFGTGISRWSCTPDPNGKGKRKKKGRENPDRRALAFTWIPVMRGKKKKEGKTAGCTLLTYTDSCRSRQITKEEGRERGGKGKEGRGRGTCRLVSVRSPSSALSRPRPVGR